MALECNIDRKGRWVRGLSGATLVAVAIVMAATGWPPAHGVRWTVSCLAGFLGAFQVFEALTGWCIVRAFGGRTPI